MGKGYNNYMCKKPFHPGSKANIKRAWMAEQKTDNDKKKQEELKVQYEKEQDLYNNRALLSTESKDKLELNFMYEAPPGAKRERQKEDDEPEYKFEWQRKYNAPREDYAKGNADIKDQPFGIPVRNVRCIKCHKWGHINTDKECPLFSQASTSSMPTTSMDPMELMRHMREDGYNLKPNVLGHHLNPKAANQQLIPSDESDPEIEFLQSLTIEQKKKLLKKLNKMSKRQAEEHRKKKKSRKKKSKDTSSESESEEETKSSKFLKTSKAHHKKTHNKKDVKRSKKETSESSSESDSDSSSSNSSPPYSNNSKRCKGSYPNKHAKKNKHSSESEDENPKLSRMSKTIKINAKHKSSKQHSGKGESSATKQKSHTNSSSSPKRKNSDLDPSQSNTGEKKSKTNHPDGFNPSCPQAIVKANYLPAQEEYQGHSDDKFRDFHRERRSPSVKQKYIK